LEICFLMSKTTETQRKCPWSVSQGHYDLGSLITWSPPTTPSLLVVNLCHAKPNLCTPDFWRDHLHRNTPPGNLPLLDFPWHWKTSLPPLDQSFSSTKHTTPRMVFFFFRRCGSLKTGPLPSSYCQLPGYPTASPSEPPESCHPRRIVP